MKVWCKAATAVLLLASGLFAEIGAAQDALPPYAEGPTMLPGAGAGGGPGQALWAQPVRDSRSKRFSPMVDAHGQSVVVPAGYYSGSCDTCGCGPGGCGCGGAGLAMGPGMYGNCPPAGTCPPYGCNDEMLGMQGVAQCGPHYFDVRAEAVFMTRQDAFGPSIAFTVDDQDPNDVVLSSQDLSFDYEPGFRVMGRYDIGPLSVFEFGYTGIFEWDSSAAAVDSDMSVNGEGDLFSLFSGVFATDPPQFLPPNIVLPGGPNAQTERSRVQSISLESDLQTVELTYRRYWVGFSPRISGTLLAGARYTRVSEDFLFHTEGSQWLDYSIDAENDLVGFQTGGDVWVCLAQGVRMGAEGKVGIYNNRYNLDTRINASVPTNLIDPNLEENWNGDKVAFISEASVDIVADILPSWSIRAGYEVLFLNSLVLAGDNFNTGKIYDNQPSLPDRVPFLDDDGDALYHGFHVGAEYVW